jgi:hypothetical protein
MSAESISADVVKILNAHGIPYMLVGSLSTNYHSIVRSTKDADIVIQAELGSTARLIVAEIPYLRMDPQLGFETVTTTKRILLRATTEDFTIELFGLSDDPHDQLRFQRRVQVEWLDQKAWLASLEDVIITKLRWAQMAGREKDYVDVRNVIAVRGDCVDWPYVEQWCEQHGSRATLEKIQSELKNLLASGDN